MPSAGRGLRSALRDAGIDFSIPDARHLEKSEKQKQKLATGNETQQPTENSEPHDEERSSDVRENDVAVADVRASDTHALHVHGRNACRSLITFLATLECDDSALLRAPHAFLHATVRSSRVERCSVVQAVADQAASSSTVTAPLSSSSSSPRRSPRRRKRHASSVATQTRYRIAVNGFVSAHAVALFAQHVAQQLPSFTITSRVAERSHLFNTHACLDNNINNNTDPIVDGKVHRAATRIVERRATQWFVTLQHTD